MADQEIKMDSGNKFLMVVSLLVLVAVVAFLVYQLVGFLGQAVVGEPEPAPGLVETVDERMAPIGRVEVATVDPDAAPPPPKPATEVYSSVCAACHDAGVAGAPKIDDGDEWRSRFDEKGLETLVSHSINGFQGMPARGGNPNLSDEELADTVAYMLERAGVAADDPGITEVAATEEPPAVEEAVVSAAEGDTGAGETRFTTCAGCHGSEGEGMGIFPKLAGQSADYIAGRLQQYRAGEQVGPNSALMMPHASALSDEAIADLAAYVATFGAAEESAAAAEGEAATEEQQAAAEEDAPTEEQAAAEEGPVIEEESASEASAEADGSATNEEATADEESAAATSVPAGDVEAGKGRYAACASCHGQAGQGMGIFPKVAGQSAEYIADRLKQYRAGEQVGPNTALMMPQAMSLSDESIADLAAYISSLE